MTAVLLFARAPYVGRVKTRLAEEVGPARALAAYRVMGRRVADAVATRFPLTVWYTPPDAGSAMHDWLGTHRYRPQSPGDLGARLAGAVAAHFAEGDGPVIAIGADAPSVNADVVSEAVRALEAADVALGPCPDGGYYLIGLRAAVPEAFADIPWGGPEVMRVTIARCHEAGRTVALLAERRDVDTAEDLAAEGVAVP